jgi:hypothetical protein
MASETYRSAYAGPDTMTRRIIMPTGIPRVDFARSVENRSVKPNAIKFRV